MKKFGKILTLFCSAAVAAAVSAVSVSAEGIPIDETNFPDEIFKDFILSNVDTNANEHLDQEEINNTTELNLFYKDIKSLQGIEYFTELQELYCAWNDLTSVDVSKNTKLYKLDCSWNLIKDKDDIKGIDRDGIYYLDYLPQRAEDIKAYIVVGDYFKYDKLITEKIYDIVSPYTFDFYALPDNSNGIVFDVHTEPEQIVCSDNSAVDISDRRHGNELETIKFTKAGNYTLTFTVRHGNKDGSDYVKTIDIEVVDKDLHTEHEFTRCVPVYTGDYSQSYGFALSDGHNMECFCGERDNIFEKHDYVIGDAEDPDCNWQYCKKCYYYKILNETLVVTDDKTGIELADLNDDSEDKPDWELDVEEQDKDEIEISGKKVIKAYDITLKEKDVEVQPDGNVRVTIPVPEGADGPLIKIYRKEKNGTYTDMNAVYDPKTNTLSFITNHLSIYILAEDVPQDKYALGDLDGNSELGMPDLTLLAYRVSDPDSAYTEVGDMNEDGKISMEDLTLLSYKISSGK